MPASSPKTLPSPAQLDQLLKRANTKYRLLILLMLDAGLRVSEAVSLQIKHINLAEKSVTVRSLKKRATSRERFRSVPLSNRIIEAFAAYWPRIRSRDPDAFLFPAAGQSSQEHLSRKTVYKRLQRYSDGAIHPHLLRHCFGTRIVNQGNDIRMAQKLLGHASQQTTEIYLHIAEAEKRAAIASIEPTLPWYRTWWRRVFPQNPPPVPMLPVTRGLTRFHIGRQRELATLYDLAQKRVNVLLLGAQGMGKSHLLDNFHREKILRVDDLRQPKMVLTGILLELYDHDKEQIIELLTKAEDKPQLERICNKQSLKRLCELAIQTTQPKEYLIILDDISDMTKMGARILENLKNHFQIMAAARQLKIDHVTAVSNFQRLELGPLSRPETLELIAQVTLDYRDRIRDFEALKNHLWEEAQGNPLYTIELAERLSREPVISPELLQKTRHAASKKEVDFTVPLLLVLSSLMVLRYFGSEIGDDAGAFRIIGSFGLIIALFGRNAMRALKRKYL